MGLTEVEHNKIELVNRQILSRIRSFTKMKRSLRCSSELEKEFFSFHENLKTISLFVESLHVAKASFYLNYPIESLWLFSDKKRN